MAGSARSSSSGEDPRTPTGTVDAGSTLIPNDGGDGGPQLFVREPALGLGLRPALPPPRRPAAPNPPQQPMHREKPRAGRAEADPLGQKPATMTDAELRVARTEIGAKCAPALAETEHPMHREVSAHRLDVRPIQKVGMGDRCLIRHCGLRCPLLRCPLLRCPLLFARRDRCKLTS
jgi:hypothetical protein